MDEIAREIGEMNPDDPVRAERFQELCALSQLTRSLKPKVNKMIHARMDALAREILTLPRGHQRRALIVGEILPAERAYLEVSPPLVGCHNYSEANSGWPDINLELITKAMNDLAQEIGTMEPDDPKQTPFLKELSVLT